MSALPRRSRPIHLSLSLVCLACPGRAAPKRSFAAYPTRANPRQPSPALAAPLRAQPCLPERSLPRTPHRAPSAMPFSARPIGAIRASPKLTQPRHAWSATYGHATPISAQPIRVRQTITCRSSPCLAYKLHSVSALPGHSMLRPVHFTPGQTSGCDVMPRLPYAATFRNRAFNARTCFDTRCTSSCIFIARANISTRANKDKTRSSSVSIMLCAFSGSLLIWSSDT